MNRVIPTLLFVLIILAVLSLFSPFVFMKIGPGGYAHYGPNVPDIYIYGGDIFGKDKSWWGISFAFRFQRFMILAYILLMILSYVFYRKGKRILVYIAIGLVLLALFPYWVKAYSSGVYNNSDNADLTVYYVWGWWVYAALVGINLIACIASLRIRGRDRSNS